VINQAEVAYREFLGRNRVPLPPGLHLNLPILHTLWRVDIRERSVEIDEITGFTKDNVPIVVSRACDCSGLVGG
jgi:regulator of protease activity HflC (stomatin/prohibitin superfamily)